MTLEILNNIDHFVVVMLENRSFDHILGNLYPNGAPRGQPFDGLTGNEENPDQDNVPISVQQLAVDDPFCYFTPRGNPGEGFSNTSEQLYNDHLLVQQTKLPTNTGFVKNYQFTLSWEEKKKSFVVYEGAGPRDIMAMHTPATLPVISTLAQQYAVCDQWFCSVPSETQCNRAFMHMATSEGLIKNNWDYQFKSKSIFGALGERQHSWNVYAYDTKGMSMTSFDIKDLENAPRSNFGTFKDFQATASAGKLAAYSFLEPKWGATGNSMHPNYNVAKGEQWLSEIYNTLRNGPKEQWEKTLLIITFDEHGGCYDHVAPPANAAPPDDDVAKNGFTFDRFGVRVPFVAVSPLIEAGTVFRTENSTPFDHTSILRTIGLRFGLPPLTRRDAAAPHFANLLTLSEPRTDNALVGVTPPSATAPTEMRPPGALQKALVQRAHQFPDPDESGHSEYPPDFDDGDEAVRWAHDRYTRYRKWKYGDRT